MEKILTTLPGNARWLSRWDQGSVLGFHQRYLLLEYSPTWSVTKISIHEKKNPWILPMIWWLVYCSFSTPIQLLLLVYGQHVNHLVKTKNKYVPSCSLFFTHVPFYMCNNMLCLTAMTGMFMDITYKILCHWYHYPVWQWPPDINFCQCDKSIFYKGFH